MLSARYDAVVVVGSDYTDVTTGNEWASNAQIAANIGSPVVLVVHGRGRDPQTIAATVELARAELVAWHAHPVAVIANRVDPDDLQEVRALLAQNRPGGRRRCPEIPLLVAPTVADLQQACGAELVRGNPELLATGVDGLRGRRDVAAERADPAARGLHRDRARATGRTCCPALILAHQSATFPNLASIVLTGGYTPPESVQPADRRRAAGPADPGDDRRHLRDGDRRSPACAAG